MSQNQNQNKTQTQTQTQPQNQLQLQIIKTPRKQSQRRGGNVQQNQKPKMSPKLKRNVLKNQGGGAGAGVSFNIRKNKVDKFYCPNLPTPSTKSNPTGSVDIQDLPEIPLDSLFDTQ
jgi:hypothetical protein